MVDIVKEMQVVPVVQLCVVPDGPLYLVGTIENQGTSILAYASSEVIVETPLMSSIPTEDHGEVTVSGAIRSLP